MTGTTNLTTAMRWLRHAAEGFCGLLLVLLVLCFMLQIISRYVFNYPFGWTDEASVFFWVFGLVISSKVFPSASVRTTDKQNIKKLSIA